jgi:hypothetical protein
MSTPHVYDKAKYHDDSVSKFGLPEEHSANHTVVVLRWLIEHKLMSEFFTRECRDILRTYETGDATIHQVYAWWDNCLIDEMISPEGNEFAMAYFDLGGGRYIHDYMRALQGKLPSELHIEYTEDNYQIIAKIIDDRYEMWKKRKNSWRPFWWPFWWP